MHAKYKIIGADGQEYPCATDEMLNSWYQEKRITNDSMIYSSEMTKWIKLDQILDLKGLRPPIIEPPALRCAPSLNGTETEDNTTMRVDQIALPLCVVCGETTRPTGWFKKLLAGKESEIDGQIVHENCKNKYLLNKWKLDYLNLPNMGTHINLLAASNNCFVLNNGGDLCGVGTILFLDCGLLYLMNINHSNTRNNTDLATMSALHSAGAAAGIAVGLVGGVVGIISQSIKMNNAMIEPCYDYNLELLGQDVSPEDNNIYIPYSGIKSIEMKTGVMIRHGGSIVLTSKFGTHSQISFLLDKASVDHLQKTLEPSSQIIPFVAI